MALSSLEQSPEDKLANGVQYGEYLKAFKIRLVESGFPEDTAETVEATGSTFNLEVWPISEVFPKVPISDELQDLLSKAISFKVVAGRVSLGIRESVISIQPENWPIGQSHYSVQYQEIAHRLWDNRDQNTPPYADSVRLHLSRGLYSVGIVTSSNNVKLGQLYKTDWQSQFLKPGEIAVFKDFIESVDQIPNVDVAYVSRRVSTD